MIKKLVILAAIVVVLGVVADVAARGWAEGEIERQARASVPGARNVSASIRSFPFLLRLISSGRVTEVTASAGAVDDDVLPLDSVEILLRDVAVERDHLLDGEVRILDIASGRVTAAVTADALSRALRVPVTMEDGEVHIEVAGRTVSADVSVTNNRLRLEVDPLPALTLAFPRTDLVPCAADAVVRDDHLLVSCDFDEVPPALIDIANRGAGDR